MYLSSNRSSLHHSSLLHAGLFFTSRGKHTKIYPIPDNFENQLDMDWELSSNIGSGQVSGTCQTLTVMSLIPGEAEHSLRSRGQHPLDPIIHSETRIEFKTCTYCIFKP